MTRKDDHQGDIAKLHAIIAAALRAMDSTCYGDARRLLTAGQIKPAAVIPITSHKPGGAA